MASKVDRNSKGFVNDNDESAMYLWQLDECGIYYLSYG